MPAAIDPGLRIGQGIDVHPLIAGRRLVLGGVAVPYRLGLAGHSDADVLAHAICDALLGALGLPDMGRRFPSHETRYRGRSSLWFLGDVAREMRRRDMPMVNLDAVVLAEAPRLQPYVARMRRNIATALDVPIARVGVRVKRAEGLGAFGRGEGMMAQSVVLLASRPTVPKRSRSTIRSGRTAGSAVRRKRA